MPILGSGDIAVHEAEGVTLFYAPEALPEQRRPASAASAANFPEMYFRVENDADQPGVVTLTNLYYYFNHITGFRDPVPTTPVVWPDTAVLIPEGFTGLLYFLLQLYPFAEPTITYATALPTAVNHMYVRSLANISRAAGAAEVTIRPRFFGVLTVPGEQVNPDVEGGLFA